MFSMLFACSKYIYRIEEKKCRKISVFIVIEMILLFNWTKRNEIYAATTSIRDEQQYLKFVLNF